MLKKLTKVASELYHYVDGEKVKGQNKEMYGDCSGLSGNCTNLSGNCTGLRGNCFGLSGDCTGLSGNLDFCEITEEDRKNGIDINNLIE